MVAMLRRHDDRQAGQRFPEYRISTAPVCDVTGDGFAVGDECRDKPGTTRTGSDQRQPSSADRSRH